MTDHDWLDGTRLTEWIRERHHDLHVEIELGSTLARRWRYWERGSAAHYATADAVLTKLGDHLSLVPEEFWVPDPRPGKLRPAVSAKKQKAIAEAAKSGLQPKEIAEKFDVCTRTAWKYAQEAA